MRHKSLLIPIIVFIFSFTILSLYQKSHNTVTLASTTDLPPVLWSKTTADISTVSYSIGDKKIIAERKNEDWFLSNIDNQKADSLYIYTIISGFLEPKFKEVVTVNPEDLNTYGIDSFSPRLTLFDTAGNKYTVTKGSDLPDGLTYVYVPLSKTIYTMSADLFSNLSISTEDWLNKELLSFDPNNVSKVTFSYKGLETTLLPKETADGLIFTNTNVNQALSQKFMAFLQSSKIQQFITTNASEHILSVYGFDNPNLRCSVYLKTGETLSLVIGNIKENENICYAMANHNAIVAIPYFDFSQFDSLFADLEASNSLTLG